MQLVKLLLIVAAVTAAILAITPGVASGGRPIGGGVYNGRFVDTTSSGTCSGGVFTVGEEFSLEITDYGFVIKTISLKVTYGDLLPGPAMFPFAAAVPVAAVGSFNDDLSFGLGLTIHVEGQFKGDGVSGSLRAEINDVLECEGTFSAVGRPPEPDVHTFLGTIAEEGACGGGQISITRAGDRQSVLAVNIENFRVEGELVSASAHFDPGTVPISPEFGIFSAYFPTGRPGEEIAISGDMDELYGILSGVIEVTPSTCGGVRYTTHLIARPSGGGPSFPGVGAGPEARSALGWPWALVTAAFGLSALATGLALWRRAG